MPYSVSDISKKTMLADCILVPSMHNGGKFFMTLLVLSVVANKYVVSFLYHPFH